MYLLVRRSTPVTMLQLFDQPRIETKNCTRRGVSTVATQALTLLNSETIATQAYAFADRVLKESPTDPATLAIRSDQAIQTTLSRRGNCPNLPSR